MSRFNFVYWPLIWPFPTQLSSLEGGVKTGSGRGTPKNFRRAMHAIVLDIPFQKF